jgi:glyceraldehyde-3-phosphate dehydrogenase (NADP+)
MNKEKIKTIFPNLEQVPPEFRLNIPVIQKQYLLNGKLQNWDGPMQEVYSPVYLQTEAGNGPTVIGSYPLLSEKESMEALEGTVKAYDLGRGEWPTMSVLQRIKHMENFVKKMITKRQEVVNLLMWEIGKSYQDSQKEFDRTIDYINDTINALVDLDHDSSKFLNVQGIIGQIRRVPLGTVLSMGPFNYPLNETFTTLIPALIMGNTVVLKPPKYGVLLYYPLLEVFAECFPAGVINTVYGDGQTIIPPIMTSGKIDVLAFIGSTKVANILKKQHPKPNRLRSILGLGAKNPAIILPDADLDLTVKECLLGTLSFNGQRCSALKIIFVHADIAGQFNQRFSEAVSQLNFGMPWDKDVNITPLPETDKTKYFTAIIEDARQNGAEVINEGGGIVNGSFIFPAVVFPVNDKMRLYYEEQFGPVVPIIPFKDISEPVQYIVDSPFGQQASIFGKNTDKIASLIDQLVNQLSRININSQSQRGPDVFPFAGRKDSAETTLSVSDALRAFSIRTLVSAKGTEENKGIITGIVREHKSKFLSTDFIL